MSQVRDRNRPPRAISIREAGEFFPALSGRRIEAAPLESGVVAFYTVAQLAVRWGISERQIHRYIDSCDLIATRFGRSIRISAAEAARFETSHTVVK
jgi:excisionase family DNA binding protein